MKKLFRNSRCFLNRIIAYSVALTVVLGLCFAMAKNVYAADAGDSNDEIDMSRWMSYMPDDIQITRLNMPGTHDAGMYNADISITYKRAFYETQSVNIAKQLTYGSRVFDIRLGTMNMGTRNAMNLIVHHSGGLAKLAEKDQKDDEKNKYLKLWNVFESVDGFLSTHESETVILFLQPHDKTADEAEAILKEFKPLITGETHPYYERFIYYPKGAPVPKLGDVRGKCVVIFDEHNRTKYEDHCISGAVDKIEYFENMMDYAEKNPPANKPSVINTDTFTQEKLGNPPYDEDDKKEGYTQGDPQVKFVYMSSQFPGLPNSTPRVVSSSTMPHFAKREWKTETRYGWVFLDYLNGSKKCKVPTLLQNIAKSNQGSINYYADINNKYGCDLNVADISLIGKDSQNYSLELNYAKLYKLNPKLTASGDVLKYSVVGLPLYSPNNLKYEYTLVVNKESCSTVPTDSDINDEYKVLDGKWSARQQRDSIDLIRAVTSMPMEIEWRYSDGTPFTEPENREAFFKICRELQIKQTSSSGVSSDVKIVDTYDTVKNPYLLEFQKEGSPKAYYKTKVMNLTKYNEKGEEYQYELVGVKFDPRKVSPATNYSWKIEQGSEGQQRLIIEVHSVFNKVTVPGSTKWYDNHDFFGKRDNAFRNGLQLLRIDKYISGSDTPYPDFKIPTITKKYGDFIEFNTRTSKYNPDGTEFEKYLYNYPGEAGHYNLELSTEDNKAYYILNAPTDFTVVWNFGDGEEKTIPASYESGLTMKFSGYNGKSFELSAKNDNPGEYDWKSDEKTVELFWPNSNKGEYFYSFDEHRLNTIKTTLSEKFDVSTGTIMDVDSDGYPVRHFMMYCDSVNADKKIISGNVQWNDGLLGLSHDSKNYINLYRKAKDSEEKTDISSQLIWDSNTNHFYAALDKYEEDGVTEITYTVVPKEETDKYKLTKGTGEYDYIYTKLISVSIVPTDDSLPIPEGTTIKLMRNGSEVPSEEIKGSNPYTELPIADKNNNQYEYSAEIVPPTGYLVDFVNTETSKTTGDVTISVAFYKQADNLEIPVELDLVTDDGIEAFGTYQFSIDGSSDEGSLTMEPIELKNENGYKGKFVLDNSKLKDAKTPYYFDVYQIVGDSQGVEYDSSISCIKIEVKYLNGNKIYDAQWGEWVLEEDVMVWKPLEGVSASKFTNRIGYIPARLKIEGLKHISAVAGGSVDITLPDASFTYELSVNEGKSSESILRNATVNTNNTDKTKDIIFGTDEDPIYWYEPGELTLHVAAVYSGQKGWYYDTTPYSINVKVEKDGTNQLKVASISFDDRLTDKSIFQKYSEVKYAIPVKKVLEGTDSTAEIFKFVLQDKTDDTITKNTTITGAGTSAFNPITYYEPGDYEYTVYEDYPDGGIDWLYDPFAKSYTVKVARDDATGALKIDTDNMQSESVTTFVNEYGKQPIPVNVYWMDAKAASGTKPHRPSEISCKLLSDGVTVAGSRSITGDASTNEWSYKTEALNYNKLVSGQKMEIDYSLDIDDAIQSIGDYYDVDWFGDARNGFTIICMEKWAFDTIDIPVRVEWIDGNNKQNRRPSAVNAEIIQDPFLWESDSISFSVSNGWKNTFENLPKYYLDEDDQRQEIEYSLSPYQVSGYSLSVSYDDTKDEYVLKYTLKEIPPKDNPNHNNSGTSSNSQIVVEKMHTLYFETNGGTPVNKTNSISVPEGQIVELNNYVTAKDGRVFTGWYLDKDLNIRLEKLKIEKDTTVYAGWAVIKVPLKDMAGGKEIELPEGYNGTSNEKATNDKNDYLIDEKDFAKVKSDSVIDNPDMKNRIMKEIQVSDSGSAAEGNALIQALLARAGIGVAILAAAALAVMLFKKKKFFD